MTVQSNEQNASTGVARIGLTITRESVPSLARSIAEEIYFTTTNAYYNYRSDAAGKDDLARHIGSKLHLILDNAGVDSLYCKFCGKTQQEHEWIGGWCNGVEHQGKKFEKRV